MDIGVLLNCLATLIINTTPYPWNTHDEYTMNSSKKVCIEKYPEAPCLKKFIKKGERNYWAICGASNENN